MSTRALEALRDGCRADDPTLMQGATCDPPPLMCTQDFPCKGGCALGYAGWKGEELETVGEVEAFFARACFEADQRLGEPAACRWFLNFFDDTPRDIALKELADEIDGILATREAAEGAS
jgi:hypothetical protein